MQFFFKKILITVTDGLLFGAIPLNNVYTIKKLNKWTVI